MPLLYVNELAAGAKLTQDENLDQVRCVLHYPVTGETIAFGRFHRWWFIDGGEPWDDFVAEVEARPEFLALRDARPAWSEVSQGPA